MIQALYFAALALGLGVLVWRLVPPDPEASPARIRLQALSCFVFAAAAASWPFAARIGSDGAAMLALAAEVSGAAAFGCGPSPRARRALGGALLGLFLSAVGVFAHDWRPLLGAVERLSFAGAFFGALLPLLCALSAAAACAVCLVPDLRPYRNRALAAILVAWAGSAWTAEHLLRTRWDFGPRSLAEAADVPHAREARVSVVAVLRPTGGREYLWERRIHAALGVDASPGSLERVHAYLERRGYRTLFLREGLAALRKGWLDSWEADRALEAAALAVPGRVTPDYVLALNLLRSGPITDERYEALRRLDRVARTLKGGFEDVNRSQRIFEAFSAAYARFGDEPSSKDWLLRVDDLWPLYEKKIEVTQVESRRDGVVRGRLLLDGRPASSVRVALFHDWLVEPGPKRQSQLSSSTYPDSEGRFAFFELAPGSYHLELMGTPEQLRGRIDGSPGQIELSDMESEVDLGVIGVDRKAGPDDARAPSTSPRQTPPLGNIILLR